MHIPDGFLSNRIALSMDVVSGATVFYATRRVTIEGSGRMVPIMGVMAAFVLAAQMLNFPVLGGTSGHLVGGALLSVLLGPMAAFLTMATVIIAQALFMQDGGIVAIGANLFNIGAITSFSGFALFRMLEGGNGGPRRIGAAAFVAGWGSLMLSAVCCAIQLALSGAVPLRAALGAMAGYHAIIGIAEGGLTAGVVTFLLRVRPDLARREGELKFRAADWVGAMLLVAVPVLILLLAGSSSLPDPLQALLTATGGSAPTETGELSSTVRYWEFAELAGAFVLLIGVAYLASFLARRRKDAS
jgi:cobalt/nickel transport system permease protein